MSETRDPTWQKLGDVADRVIAKVIPTRYASIVFRSRTEARWARFFDALATSWRYEAEGFDLHGVRYLPDFFLPALDIFVEVKGVAPCSDECEKARLLAAGTGKKVLLVIGAPDNLVGSLFTPGADPDWYGRPLGPDTGVYCAFLSRCPACATLCLQYSNTVDRTCSSEPVWSGVSGAAHLERQDCPFPISGWSGRLAQGLEAAIAAASNERFDNTQKEAAE